MAIIMNAIPTTATLGGRLALNQVVTAPAAAASTPAPAAATPSQQSAVSALTSAAATAAIVQTPVLKLPVVQPPAQNQTATQLAGGAIAQLSGAAAANVTQALNAIKSKSLDGPGLIPYLERKVRIGEVLNDLAKDWSAPTRSDFAGAFSMDPNNINNDVADSIVSIAILNDKDLEGEILAENTPQTAPADLTDNRRIVWQSVAPGTVLNPPYVILVAVEYQDVATAQDTLHAITAQLGTTASGFRLPTAVIQKGVN